MPKVKPITSLRRDRWQLNRRWVILAGVIALVIAGFKVFTLATGHSNIVDQGLTEGQGHAVHVIDSTSTGLGSLRHVFRIPALLRENRRLKQENELLEREKTEMELRLTDDARLMELRKQLDFSGVTGFKPVAAQVTARPYDLWLESAILNIGRADGVRLGNLAANEFGIAGRVIEVQEGNCRLQLASSPQFRLGAVAIEFDTSGHKASEIEGVVRGVSTANLEMDYPADTNISIGWKVFSRGEQREPGADDNRPRGVYIGVVHEVIANESGVPVKILIKPAANIAKLGNVVVYTR